MIYSAFDSFTEFKCCFIEMWLAISVNWQCWYLCCCRSLTIGGIAGLCLCRKKGSDLLAGCRRIQEGGISCAAVVSWMLTHTRRARGRGVLRLLLAGSGCIQGGDANAEEVDNAGGGKKNKGDGFLWVYLLVKQRNLLAGCWLVSSIGKEHGNDWRDLLGCCRMMKGRWVHLGFCDCGGKIQERRAGYVRREGNRKSCDFVN